MGSSKKYSGVAIPTVTPFKGDGDLDLEAAAKISEHIVTTGAAVFVLGTTGEAMSIGFQARARLVSVIVQKVAHRTRVYAGISDNCLNNSIEMAKQYTDLGVDVLVAHLPSYYPLTDEDILAYYERLADRIAFPLMLYNIPITTNRSIPLTIIDQLSHHPNIVGLKDSEHNGSRLDAAIQLWKDRSDFSHFMGCGSLCAAALALGSDGIVPGTGNIIPRLFVDLYESAKNDQKEAAERLQQLANSVSAVYHTNKPISRSLPLLKSIMHLLGFCEPTVLSPLRTMTPNQMQEVAVELTQVKLAFLQQGYSFPSISRTEVHRICESKLSASLNIEPAMTKKIG
jgi:dihydrodipicolinate synthase/N-acetylneuraminate lyase